MSSSIDFSEYSELVGEGGFDVKTPVSPENEFFHAAYISGQSRQNHIGEMEIPGKLQIRGVRSNLDEIKFVITHIKQMLVNNNRVNNRDNLVCFSYQQGNPPWKGTSGNICGKNAADRAANPFCNKCRSQLVVAGFLLDENTGKPFLIDGKETYIFIRAKGVKYGNVANYLSELAKRDDLEPIVTPVTDESRKFEKSQVNHKRFVTVVKVGKENTNFGMKDVFVMEPGANLSVSAVKNTLNKAKETMEKFKEKFDWSRGKIGGGANYAEPAKVDDSQKFDFGSQPTAAPSTTQEPPKPTTQTSQGFSFEDVDF